MADTARASRPGAPGRSIESLLLAATEEHGDRPALLLGERRVTYTQLAATVARLAERLGELAPDLAGQRVLVIGQNVPALAAGMFAAWRRGAVAVPLSARLREFELTGVLADAEPVAVVTVESYRGYSFVDLVRRLGPELRGLRGALVVDEMGEVLDELPRHGENEPERLGEDIGLLLYTSGTTGEPKGALVQHAREAGAAEALAGVLELTAGDACAQVIPIAHAFGLSCMLTAFSVGARVVLADSSVSVRPLLESVHTHGATILNGSPALFISVLKAAPDGVPGVRRGFVGGAGSPAGLLEQLDRVGMRILNLYGMTEIAAAACCRPDDPPAVRYTTAGSPLPGFEWHVEPSTEVVRDGGGELWVRGPWVTPGYFRRPEETAEAFVDGWFRTGDIGDIDDEGHVRITGRLKEVVHVAGFSVFPAEVEGFLLTHPDVAQAAVVGAPDERFGEALQAFVVPRGGAELTPTALLQYARGKIADYKLPYRVRLVAELPLLASGKPDRVALRATAARSDGTGTSA